MNLIKRLFCRHYWDLGDSLETDIYGLRLYTCLKCGKQVINVFPWGSRRTERSMEDGDEEREQPNHNNRGRML
jgi:hypothetical protein